MRNRQFIINAILMITISIFSAATVFAQSNEVLVAGDPAFAQSDFEEIVKYYERGLDIKFSDDERNEFQMKITAMWRKNQKSNPKNLVGFMKNVEKFNTIADEKIKAHQQEFTDALLADLKTMSRNGWSPFVVSIYENARRNDSITAERESHDETPNRNETQAGTKKNETRTSSDQPNFQPITGAIRMSDLVGKWNKGTVASYGYRNTVTNDYTSGYGSANMHEVRANGSFDYSNFAQISLYGCTTELFTSMKGRAAISGSQVTFSYLSGNVKGKDSCRSEGFNRPAQISNATYRLERDGSHLRLCEVGKETPSCLYKEEN
ncbi:MAG TPA: hypothetical protein VK308_09495 [Pyrinomonadaceae bacterium]|nr:hypothetical protein [Pyrinomonadaceae bacterium]